MSPFALNSFIAVLEIIGLRPSIALITAFTSLGEPSNLLIIALVSKATFLLLKVLKACLALLAILANFMACRAPAKGAP